MAEQLQLQHQYNNWQQWQVYPRMHPPPPFASPWQLGAQHTMFPMAPMNGRPRPLMPNPSHLMQRPPPPPCPPPPVSDEDVSPEETLVVTSAEVKTPKQPPGTTPVRFNLPSRRRGLLGPMVNHEHQNKNAVSLPPSGQNMMVPQPGQNRKGRPKQRPPPPRQPPPVAPPPPPSDVIVVNTHGRKDCSRNVLPEQLQHQTGLDMWPDSLQKYVSDCFKHTVSELDKECVEQYLKEIVTQACERGSVRNIDWEAKDVPRFDRLGEAEKKRFAVLQKLDVGERMQLLRILHPPQDFIPLNVENCGRSSLSRGGLVFGQNRFTNRTEYRHRRTRHNSRSRSRSPPHSAAPHWLPPEKKFRKRHSSSESEECTKVLSAVSLKSSANKFRSKNKPNKNKRSKAKKQKAEAANFTHRDNVEKLQKRAARFQDTLAPKDESSQSLVFTISNRAEAENDPENEEFDWSSYNITGTNTNIEKPYLRLTGLVDPSLVRPVAVLQKSLTKVQEMWKQNHDYNYACEQLKSIRQDLTVQGVRDEFAILCYETHARIALEKGDPEEFNQCQSQLKMLYSENCGKSGTEHSVEFVAYRILYYIYTRNTLDLTTTLATLTTEMKQDKCVSFALKVRTAWALSDFCRLFMLCKSAPKMTGYIMDWFTVRERKHALKVILKAFRPVVPISMATAWLGFASDQDCSKFLIECAVVFTNGEQTHIQVKSSLESISQNAPS